MNVLINLTVVTFVIIIGDEVRVAVISVEGGRK